MQQGCVGKSSFLFEGAKLLLHLQHGGLRLAVLGFLLTDQALQAVFLLVQVFERSFLLLFIIVAL